MILTEFDYVRPVGLDEALTLLAGRPGARVLAGGQSLLPGLRTGEERASLLVDVRRLEELRGIGRTPAGIRIGSMTTLAELAADPLLLAEAPEIAAAARANGDPQVRNLGTAGGNLAATGRATDLPVAAIAAGATAELAGPGGVSTITAEELAASGVPVGTVITALLVPAAAGAAPPSRRPPTGRPATRSAPPRYGSPPTGRGSRSPGPPPARCGCAGSKNGSAGARTPRRTCSRPSAPNPGSCSSRGAAPRPSTSATSRAYSPPARSRGPCRHPPDRPRRGS